MTARYDARARNRALFLGDSHAGDEASQCTGNDIDQGLGAGVILEHQAGGVRKITDGDVGGLGIAHDVQSSIHRGKLDERGAALSLLTPDARRERGRNFKRTVIDADAPPHARAVCLA